jgi:hypothetical protein
VCFPSYACCVNLFFCVLACVEVVMLVSSGEVRVRFQTDAKIRKCMQVKTLPCYLLGISDVKWRKKNLLKEVSRNEQYLLYH